MNGLIYELKKIILHQKGWLYVAAFLLVSAPWLMLGDAPYSSAMEQYAAEYQWYLQQVDGRYTQDKADFLEAEAGAIAQAEHTRQTLMEGYYSGEITQEEYRQGSAPLEAALAHQNGFEVIFEQYLFICENPSNRYFVQTNGWTGLLKGGGLDILLLLAILLLVTPVFCREYSCQMDGLIMTAKDGRKSPWYKLLIVAVLVLGLCLAASLIDFGFYACKYGLPNGDYPIQSIGYFSSSAKQISLLGGYLMLTAIRCFGGLFFALLLLLCSVLVKKYALTLVLGVASVLIPYVGLSAITVYRLPLPLPFLLATGFLTGSSYTTDKLTGDQVAIFQEISVRELLVLWGISALLCLGAVYFIVHLNTNRWQVKTRKKPSRMAMLLWVPAILTLFGCSDQGNPVCVYNSFTLGAYPDYEITQDVSTQRYYLKDNATDEVFDLPRSPLFGVFSDSEKIKSYYVSAPYIYYSAARTEQHIDRVGLYHSSATQVSVIALNLETFEERVIFEQVTDSSRSLLGIEYETGDQWAFLEFHRSFFLNEDSIFFVGNKKITEVNRKTKRIQTLDIDPGGTVAFDGCHIFYINEASMLTKFDTISHTKAVYEAVIAYDFCLDAQEIYYIDPRDSNHVYRCDLEGKNSALLCSTPSVALTCDENNIYLTTKQDGSQIVLPKPA